MLGGAASGLAETKGAKGSRWTGVARRRNVVAAVFNASSAEAATQMQQF